MRVRVAGLPPTLDPGETEPLPGSFDAAVTRWGHVAWAGENGVCVWGGAPGADGKEVLVLGRDAARRRTRKLTTGEAPIAREAHSVAPVTRNASTARVIFGGFAEERGGDAIGDDDDARRASHGRPLNDAHLLDDKLAWRRLRPKGAEPTPRGDHAAVAIAHDKVLVHGGCTSRGPGSPAILLNDCHVLTVQCRGAAWTSSVKIESRWDAIANATGAKPSPRSNHTAVHVPDGDFGDDLERRLGDEASGAMRIPDARHGGGVVYVFGGAVNVNKTDRSRALVDVSDDLFAYDVDDRRWSKLRRPYVTSGKSKRWQSAR